MIIVGIKKNKTPFFLLRSLYCANCTMLFLLWLGLGFRLPMLVFRVPILGNRVRTTFRFRL